MTHSPRPCTAVFFLGEPEQLLNNQFRVYKKP